jgi:hypothetical protein
MRSVRTVPAIGCTVLLLLLAGCAGVPGFGGGGEAYTGPDEPLNTTALQADHAESLRGAGSFTVSLNGSSQLGNDSSTQRTTARVDLERNRTLQRSDLAGNVQGEATGGNSTVYVENETVYVRLAFRSGNETRTQYRVVNGSQQPTQASPAEQFLTLDQFFTIADGANWTQQGTERFQGTTVTRYVANGTGSFNESALATGGAPAPNVSAFDATMLVTADGTVRKLTYTIEASVRGQAVTVGNEVLVSDVGSTTVETPGWLDEARNASDAAGSPPGDVPTTT